MYKSEVFKSWTLVLQLGISMLVPIFMLVAVGYLIKTYLKVDLMLVFVILGLVVGIRNVYAILKNYLNSMENSKNKESELMKRHLKSIESK
ncbi:MAG: AtpZ/AtpI family protein [Lachnospiraceae bacterium]|nr:AtpZ/AtpI family protein [Lachnospiraceae bacterium]